MAWSRKSYLGPVEIASYVCLVSFRYVEHMVIPRFHLLVFDMNQENEEAGGVQDFLMWPQGWNDIKSSASC